MKKLILSLIAASVAIVCALTGCGGTYVPPSGGTNGGSSTVKPTNPDEQSTGDFTVRLVNQDGTQYTDTENLTVSWNDGNTQPVTAAFGDDNIARASNLDGDYLIKITGLPENIAYDPNGNYATSYARKVDVPVYTVTPVESYLRPGSWANGQTLDGAITLPNINTAYSVNITSATAEMFFAYTSNVKDGDGMYEVRSLVDVDDNNINPRYRYCYGSTQSRYLGDAIDGGGAAGSYTVNFIYETGFNRDELGNVLYFGIGAETRTLDYPVKIVFLFRRTGDYKRQDINAPMVIPEEFREVQSGMISEDAFREKIYDLVEGKSGGINNFVDIFAETGGLLNGDNIKLNEKTGYYQIYDEETGVFGPVICAKITANIMVIGGDDGEGPAGMSFSQVEWQGNKALTINDNYDWNYKKETPKYSDKDPHYLNYKVFIEGYEGIIAHEKKEDTALKEQFKEYKGVYGYADFVVNGVYPVNEELKRFLQGYATNARLFLDGNGYAEGSGLRSAEEDQWLFACGYFR